MPPYIPGITKVLKGECVIVIKQKLVDDILCEINKMRKSLKKFLSLVLVFTMIICSKSFFVFAEGIDNDLNQESETVIEEVIDKTVEETDETKAVDETSEDEETETDKGDDTNEPESEEVEDATEKEEDEDESKEEAFVLESDEVVETTKENDDEDETQNEDVESESNETESSIQEESIGEVDKELLGSVSSGQGYSKNIIIKYDLAGGEWDENADTTDEFGRPYLTPESTDEIEELAGGEDFDFAVTVPRRDNYKFKGWRLNKYYPLRYFSWSSKSENFKHALIYMSLVSASAIHEDVFSEFTLVADWEYIMDTIEYSIADTDGYGYFLINTDLETEFSKTDYVEYIERLREQVTSAARYLKDVVVKVDGVEVGRLVEDFGGRFNRDDYICNDKLEYVFEREFRDIDIIYDLDGGRWATINGKEYFANKVKAKSEVFKLPELDKVEKDDFNFVGWKIDGVGEIVDSLPAGDVTEINVVAIYERSHSKISYDLNGGRWVNATGKQAVERKKLDETVDLPGKDLVYRRGYKLLGWKVDGEGETLTSLGVTDDDVNLVAAWEEVELRKVELAGDDDFWYAGANIAKEDIKTITFTTVAPTNYASTWKINGNDIVGYVTSNKDVYVYAADDVQITAYPVRNQEFYKYVSLFEGFTSLEKIDNLGLVDASETVYLWKLFKDCENLKEVDFEGFDTSQVKELWQAFMNTGFEELDLTMLDTSNAYMYQDAFSDCKNLKVLSLNLASMNYSNSAIDMFKNCPELIAVFVPDDFAGSRVAASFAWLDESYNHFAKLNSNTERTYSEENGKVFQANPEFKVATDDNKGVLTAQSYAPAQIGTITYDFSGETVSFVNPQNIYNEKLYGRSFYLPIAEEMSYNKNLVFGGWYRDEACTDGPIAKLLTDEKGDITVYAKWVYPSIKWYTLNGGKELHLTYKNVPNNALQSGEDYYAEKLKMDEGVLQHDVIEKIVVDDKIAFADKASKYDPSFFEQFTKLKEIVGLSKIDFSRLKDFSGMFVNCESLESVDLTGVNTNNAESFELMFANTPALKSVNFGNIDTSKVKNMSYMFAASGIESVDFRNINTSEVTNMSHMFYDATNLKNVVMRNFNTLNVKDFSAMFKNCTSLDKIDISSFELTYKVGLQNFAYMFSGCSNLVTILATDKFDLCKLKEKGFSFTIVSMFDGCDSLVGEKGTTVAVLSQGKGLNGYADIAHIDGREYNAGLYDFPKPGVFSTKNTAIVIYRSIGSEQRADVRAGYGLGDKILPYVDLGAEGAKHKYYADPDKRVELSASAMRADVAKKIIYVEYYKPATPAPKNNNSNSRRSGGSSSGSSSSGSSSASVGPIQMENVVEAVAAEVANQNAQATPAQEVAPNAVTNQEGAKSASSTSMSASNNDVTWEKNADGTWSLSLSVGNQNVTAANTFCTLTETNVVTGQQTNAVYYFDEKGQMATGWVKDSVGNMYFFETANTADVGKMTTGWKSVNGSYYYFGADGKMMTNGVTPDGYYVGANGVWIA